jgi:hypothetical protein
MTKNFVLVEADLPLEVAILLIAGLMMLFTGMILFPVAAGILPYYENGLYGLLLFVFALQIITLGKTPFGEMRRSIPLIVFGMAVAGVGIVTCFIPDLLGQIPRILLFICLTPGGSLLFLQMFISKKKLQTWIKYGGIFRHLVFGCGAVYLLSIAIGLLVLLRDSTDITLTAVVALVSGFAVIYLALVLRNIYLTFPQTENISKEAVHLSIDKMMLLVTGVFMLLLGVLLIPVNLGQLPFSGSAQLGLLMVIFAIQMLASGSTPIGAFPRSWLMIILGLLLAVLGIISSIVPGILVKPLTIVIGVLNILGGISSVLKIVLPRVKKSKAPRAPIPPVLRRFVLTQSVLGFLSILFGTSMLVSHFLPGLVVGVILFANGCILLYLIVVLLDLEKTTELEAGKT